MSHSRVFALLIGIDRYRSGNIWNLTSCEDDAQNMKRWLTRNLGVPKDHICLLLNEKATKQGIEDAFERHLYNNPEIEEDDAIVIYFAGHGSSVTLPADWPVSSTGSVDILCTYDQEHRKSGIRVSGITDRSLHAMIDDLSQVKGRNITVIVDSCFSPRHSGSDVRDRQSTRWAPSRIIADDLHAGLWRSALSKTSAYTGGGFFTTQYNSHVLLSACEPGGKAGEGKEGGKFTVALLHATSTLPLHEMSYRNLTRHLMEQMGEQQPRCLGYRKDSILFDQVPFVPHPSFIPLGKDDASELIRIEAGEMHGIVAGTEFSIHDHNYRGSHNPPLTTLHAHEVHHTWSLAKPIKRTHHLPDRGSYAKVSRWNNTNAPFKVHLQRTYTSVITGALRGKVPWKRCGALSKDGLILMQVKKTVDADITLRVHRNKVVVKHQSDNPVQFPVGDDNNEVIEKASRFYHHLSRTNLKRPLREHLRMELFHLDPESGKPIGKNLLGQGMAKLAEPNESAYAVHLHNDSHTDLWVHLAYMDTNGYVVKMLYRPDTSAPSNSAPLKRHSHFIIGTGTPGSEAIRFSGQKDVVGYLKVFVSSDPTCLDFLEQGCAASKSERKSIRRGTSSETEAWDTLIAGVVRV